MFSTVYILGAALSVASVMLVAIFLHVKTSNIYPEYSRDKLLYATQTLLSIDKNDPKGTIISSERIAGFSPQFAQTIADSLKPIANVAVVKSPTKPSEFAFQDNVHVNMLNKNVYVGTDRFENITTLTVTPDIFGVYDYEFVDGAPFTAGSDHNAVISDRLARKIFGADKGVTGRTFKSSETEFGWDGFIRDTVADFTVCGVFKEGSRLLPYSFAEVIAPLNLESEIANNQFVNIQNMDDNAFGMIGVQGKFGLIIRPHDGVSASDVSGVINAQLHQLTSIGYEYPIECGYMNNVRMVNQTTIINPDEYSVTIGTYPRGSTQMILGNQDDITEEFNFVGITKLYGMLILVLLLVPALNLSSLISGNMDTKMSEMGIRKAFGARNGTLLRQVMN